MIDLTPLEVRKKREDFRRALRGYEPADVDNFLELVADRLEQLVKENLTLAERVARLEAEVGEYRERERALTDALVTAQEMREELRRQAAKDAELLRREAEAEAARLRAVLPSSGQGYELDSIAAAVIGGAQLSGGVGSVIGGAIGALLIRIIDNGLVMAGAPGYWFRVFIAIVLILAVVLNTTIREKTRRMRW